MEATTTINEQLKFTQFSPSQRRRFGLLGERVKRKEMSANKAYKYAQADGDEEDDKGFKGSLKDFINLSNYNGWFEGKDMNIEREMEDVIAEADRVLKPTVKEEPKTNYVVPILIGVGVAVLLIYAIKKFGSKQN